MRSPAGILGILGMAFALGGASLPVPAANCTTGAKAAADIWNKYDDVAMAVGCGVKAGVTTAVTAGAGLPAAAMQYANCFRKTNRANRMTRAMIKGWNDLNKNGWGTIGPRKLLVGEAYEGGVHSQSTRMYITPAPVTAEMLDIRVVKRDLKANRGQAEVTVCRFPPAGPGTDVQGEKLWSFQVEPGGDNRGKLWSRTLAGVRGHIVTVAFKSQSVAKSFKYWLEASEVETDHRMVIAGSEGSGQTGYRVDVDGRGIEQVAGTLDGFEVSVDPQDDISGKRARGTVGSGNDGFRVVGDVTDIELDEPSSAQAYVDGRLWSDSGSLRTVVIDGAGGDGATKYRIAGQGPIEQVSGSLNGIEVSIQGNDRVEGGEATGRVAGGADGFTIAGDVESVELEDPSAAAVYVDGRAYEPVDASQALPNEAMDWAGSYSGRADGRRARLVVESNRSETALEMQFEDLDRGTELTTRIPGSEWPSGPDHVLADLVFTGDGNKKQFGQLILHNGGEHIAGYSQWKDDRFGVAFSRDGFEAAAGSGERVSSVEDWSGRYRGFGDGRRVELILEVEDDMLEMTWRGLDRDAEFTGEIVMLDEGNAPDHVIESVELTSPDGSSKQIGHLYLHTWDDHYISGNTVWKGKPYGVQFARVD